MVDKKTDETVTPFPTTLPLLALEQTWKEPFVYMYFFKDLNVRSPQRDWHSCTLYLPAFPGMTLAKGNSRVLYLTTWQKICLSLSLSLFQVKVTSVGNVHQRTCTCPLPTRLANMCILHRMPSGVLHNRSVVMFTSRHLHPPNRLLFRHRQQLKNSMAKIRQLAGVSLFPCSPRWRLQDWSHGLGTTARRRNLRNFMLNFSHVKFSCENIFGGRGNWQKLNARNMCCRQIIMHLIFWFACPTKIF